MKFYKKTNRLRINLERSLFLFAVQLTIPVLSVNSYAQSQQQTVNKPTEEKSQQTQPAAASSTESNKSNPPVFPAVTVEGKASQEATGYAAKRSSTATKTDTPIIEVPQSISVVTRRELDMRSVQNFTEALRYVPGVTVDQFGFDGRGFEYLLMRGFNGNPNANFRDGLSNAAQGLFFGGFITDTYGLERVDVLRGPSSVMFGRGDAGGIVNRITKRPNATPVRELEFQYGNFDRKRIAADIGAVSKDGTIMFRLVTTALDTDTQVKQADGDRAHNERFYIAPSITWRPTVDTTITLMGDILNNRSQSSPFYITAPDGSFTKVLQGDTKFSRYSTDQSSFSYQIEHHFNEIFTIRQNFRQAQQNGRFRDLFSIGYNTPEQPTLMDRDAYGTRERLRQTVLDTHLQAKLNTGLLHHTMLLGVDWNHTHASMKYFEGYTDGYIVPGIDILNPVYSQSIPSPDLLVNNAKQKIDQLGFYIQDQVRYNENWILTLGGRFDRIHSRNTDTVNLYEDPAANSRAKESAFTGRAGLTYLFSNGIAPYVSYAQSFLPQPGLSSTGHAFNPTRGDQYEVGIKYQPVGGKSLYTVALFDLTKTNVLTRDPNDISGARFVQTGEIGSRGAELEARGEVLRGLNAVGTFTYYEMNINKSNNDNVGKMPVQVPNTLTSAWLDYSLGSLGIPWLRGFGIGGGVRYVGRVFNDEQNTSSTPAFTLFDATLRYENGPIYFTINASNVFNKEYIASTFVNRNYLGTERTVVGTLAFRF